MSKNVTIITGANRGIGRAVALRMQKEGAVLVTARDQVKAEQICKEIRDAGGTAEYCVGDVSDPALAKAVSQKLVEMGGVAHNLILNAGISTAGPVSAVTAQLWRQVFGANVDSAFYFVSELLPGMLERKAGTICLLAGKAGVKAYRSMALYSASKFALVGFAQALAEDVRSKGVKVFPLCPGPVDTDMTAAVIDGLVKRGMPKEEAISKVAAGSDQKRLLTAEEVAEKVAWLCSAQVTAESGKPVLMAD